MLYLGISGYIVYGMMRKMNLYLLNLGKGILLRIESINSWLDSIECKKIKVRG